MDIISKGVDISLYQGDFDYQKARAEGFDFAIIKGGGGDGGLYTDKKFQRNYDNAKRLGIPVGIYWFSKALTVDRAVEEADYFFEKCLQGRCFELPVYIDVEHKAQLALGKRLLTDIIHAWCQRLEDKGYWVGIYSSQSYFATYMIDSELQRYAHWIACWDKSCGYQGDCFGMWQYGGSTNLIRSNKVAGVVCDQDYMLVDYPAMIKAKGCNGFTEQPKAEPVEDDASEEISLPVLRRGDKGSTVRALQALLISSGFTCGSSGVDGSFGPATERAVVSMQEKRGLNDADGIVGSLEWRTLLGVEG